MDNTINLPKTRAEATETDSSELSKEQQRLFGRDVVVGVYYMLLDSIPCNDDGDRAKSSTSNSPISTHGLQQ